MEGARLRATVGLYRDYLPSSANDTATILDGDISVSVSAGSRVFVNLMSASSDETAFPEPLKIKLDRPMSSYLQYGLGPHQCAGMDASMTAMTALFKVVFGLKNLRRAQGTAPGGGWYGESRGELKTLQGPGGVTVYMTPDQSSIFPFPTTMKIWWDAE